MSRNEAIVPANMRYSYCRNALAFYLYRLLENHAYETLPQYEGVHNGDWAAAGYELEEEFPCLTFLANDYDEWSAFLKRRDENNEDIEWKIYHSIDEDDFDALVEDFVDQNSWQNLTNKDAINDAMTKFCLLIDSKVEQEQAEEED